ncbi:M24 family metallopeptidase [Synergistes jonesii]|uniref:M24 family metallopeptidase n=1 Tax=Synergistes jonesii TaxID=2754 RepID=UPI002A747375|nr:Xaa-Pro peptidase family protein [Synergistes jonesii]MDY2985974.1 Xaa-Pro peptidase family protein [Synergistes jonesii]
MFNRMKTKVAELQGKMAEQNVDVTLVMDPDSVYYFTGIHDYLGMDFGRPTIAVIPQSGEVSVIIPSLEINMGREMTWVKNLLPWTDGIGEEWRGFVKDALKGKKTVGLELNKTHPVLGNFLKDQCCQVSVKDMYMTMCRQRMVKSPDEIAIMKKAGQVAVAMCQAAHDTIAAGVPEYEVALAIINGGTRKYAELLKEDQTGVNQYYSPMTHDLQILQTGHNMHMVHKRASVKTLNEGDSVYMCFCNLAEFKCMKIGFDRQYFIGRISKEEEKLYYQAIEGQKAALDMIRPGVKASDVHKASAQYYEDNGYGICYRTGRSVGYSRLEKPELRVDDDTVLEEGMTFAVDGAVSLSNGLAGRIGDSILVTKDGWEYLTPMDKSLQIL